MNRQLRRDYAERWKERIRKRRKCWGWDTTPVSVGINAKTRKLCSWYCCGSRRKYDGRSLQELKQFQEFQCGIEEWILR